MQKAGIFPPAFHQVLEKHGNLYLTHLDQFKVDLLTQVEKILKDTLAHLQANQPPPSPHSPPRAEPQSVEGTPKAPTSLGHSNKLDFFIPTKSGEEPEGKGRSIKRELSPGPSHVPSPKQTRTHPESEFFPSPTTTVEELPREPQAHKAFYFHPSYLSICIPTPSGDSRGEGARMMENLATAMGRDISVPLT
ncbi:hypothetical protein OPQ81_000578 [Rhizoctonia solani]|nr:hypothetical protein OPQ81_000578 [Rhizoctonia solani]